MSVFGEKQKDAKARELPLSGFNMSESELKVLAKQLKQKCSTGGTVKNGMIEIQGDHREILKVELQKRGLTAKLAGG